MISISYHSNPFQQTTDSWQSEHGLSIWQVLRNKFGADWQEFEMPTICLVNGVALPREAWSEPLEPDDHLDITVVMGGPFTPFIVPLIIGLVAGAASYIYTKQALASIGNPASLTTPDAGTVYNLSGQKNSVKMGQPIEIGYGQARMWPSYAALVYEGYENNEQFNYSLYCVGQGSYSITDLKIEDTPITSFPDVQYEVIQPGGSVTLFPDNVITSVEVANIQLYGPTDSEYTGVSGPYVINPPTTLTTRIEFDISFPQGLYQTLSGSFGSVGVSLEFEYHKISDTGSSLGAWTSLGVETITRNTNTPQRITLKYTVPAGRYEVRGKRTSITPPATSYLTVLIWESVRAFLPSTKTYGGLTMLAIVMRASNSLNNSSQSRVNLIATRKLPIWNPSTGWSAIVPTRSIVWAFCDIFRSSVYGCNLDDSYLDLAGLYSLDAEYTTRGWHFDHIFDTSTTVWDAAKTIARCGRAAPVPVGPKITMVLDTSKSITTAVFAPHNMVKDSFQIDYRHPQLNETDHVIMVYRDPTTWLEEEVICQFSGSPLANPERIDFPGCTSRAQAYHEGMYILATRGLIRDTITFKTGLEGHLPVYGDLIEVRHDSIGLGLQSGWVTYMSGYDLAFSEPVVYEAGKSYVVLLRRKDGSADGPYNVDTHGRTGKRWTVNLTAAPSLTNFTISPDGLSSPDFFDFMERPAFIFGEAANLTIKCKVISVTPSNDDTVEISCVNYDDGLYVWDSASVPAIGTDMIPPRMPDLPVVSGLMVSHNPFDPKVIIVAWAPALGAKSYILERNYDGTAWTPEVITSGTSHTMIVVASALNLRLAAQNVGVGSWVYWSSTVGVDKHEPATPIIVSSVFDTSIYVSWQPSVGAVNYRVEISAYGVPGLYRSDVTTDLNYNYTYAMAVSDGLSRIVNVRVYAVNSLGDSVPVDVVLTNSVPPAPVTIYSDRPDEEDPSYATLNVTYSPPADFLQYRFYVSATSGFTPGPTNMVYEGTDAGIAYSGSGYFVVGVMDIWGPEVALSAEQAF